MNQKIPDGWNKVKFKELAKQKSVRIDNPGESGFEKYVGLEHLDSGELVVKRYGSTSDVTSTMKLFNKGNILFARRNTYLRRVSVVPFDGVCSGDIIVLEPILDHIVEGFLPIFMQFEPFENKIIALSAGAFSKRIKWKQLAEEDIVIPSIEEQKKIVEVLWSIEGNIEKENKVIKIIDKIKKGLLNELLTKGINHKKFKKTELKEIPDKWSVGTINDLAQIIMGQSPKGETYNTVGEGEPLINGPAEFNEYYPSTFKWTSKPTKMCEVGDILFCVRGNTVGRVNFADQEYCIGRGIAAIRGKTNKGITPYIHLLLDYNKNQIYRIANGSGSTFPNINSSQLKNWPCIIPPVEEQKQIVTIFKSLDISVKSHSDNIENLSCMGKKLTNDFLSGKLIIPKEVL